MFSLAQENDSKQPYVLNTSGLNSCVATKHLDLISSGGGGCAQSLYLSVIKSFYSTTILVKYSVTSKYVNIISIMYLRCQK